MKIEKSWLKEQLQRKDCIQWQLFKYMCCGGLAVLVDQIVYYSLGLHIIPIFQNTDPIVGLGISITPVIEMNQTRNIWAVKICCWVLANTTAYVLNRLFVFETGKHKRIVETVLFFIFALPQFIFVALTDVLIRVGWEVTYANYSMMLLAVIINFLVRKFIIFKR